MPDAVFPAFLKLEHQRDGSAKASFLAEVASITGDAQKQFERSFGEIRNVVSRSLSGFNQGQFKLDLNLSSLRQAATEAELAAARLRTMKDAATTLAKSTGDTTVETRNYIAALSAQTIEAEGAARASQAQVATYSRLQQEIDRTITSTGRLAQAYRDTYLEEARAVNAATEAQRRYNEQSGITVGFRERTPKSAAASASVFESMGYKPSIDMRSGVDKLLAGSASIDRAALSATTLEQVLKRVSSQTVATGEAIDNVGRKGTSQFGAVTNSVRAHRVAMVQLGQQFQDMVVQAQMGTSAITIFTQQVPQAAFALSGLEGKVGAVARTMSGVWGAAIFGAIAVLGPFVAKLFETGDASDDAKKKVYDFSVGLDVLTLSAKNSADAMSQLADATKAAMTVQGDFLNTQIQTATASIAALEKRISEASAERAKILQDSDSLNPFNVVNARRATQLSTQIANDQDALASARLAQTNAQLAVSQRQVADSLDPATAAMNRYREAVGKLEVRFRKTQSDPIGAQLAGITLTQADYNKQLTTLQKQLKSAQDAARDAKKEARSGARELADFGSPIEGARITSGYGQRARPKAGASTNHLGIDYGAREGTPVRATQDGIVRFAGTAGGYGNQVALTHGGGTETRYSHLSRFNVADKQQVAKGDVIGFVGKTGTATGPHLHYEVLVNGKKVDPTKGAFPFDATRVAEQGEKAREAAQRTADQLQQFGERSAESIQRINEQFNVQPRLVDQAEQATRKLDDTIRDLSERKPVGFEQMIADAQTAKGVVQDALVRPFAELTRDSERRIKIQQLLTAGRDAEASALQTIWQMESRLGPLTDERKNQIYAIAVAEEAANEALERRREITGSLLEATRSIRGELESFFAGDGADFGKIIKRLQAKIVVENLFGDQLRALEKTIKTEGLQNSVDTLSDTTKTGAEALGTFADTVRDVTERIAGAGTAGASISSSGLPGGGDAAMAKLVSDFDKVLTRKAANDNLGGYDPATGEITVTGDKSSVVPETKLDRNTAAGIPFSTYTEMLGNVMTKPLVDAIGSISPALAAKLGPMIGGAAGGLMSGGIPGAILGGLKELPGISKGLSKALGKGLEGAQTGSMVAGLGKSLGLKMSETGAQIGGAIGSFIPIPGGSLIGSVIGGFLGGIFKKVKSGYAQIRPSNGTAEVTGTYGRTGEFQSEAVKAANGLLGSIRTIAERFNAEVGGFDLDIGRKDDKFAVTSSRVPGGTKWFADEEEAMRYAIRDAIAGGAIKGIREGTKRILQAGADIDTQMQKAMDFENVFKRLRAQTDPVGAALDAVDTEFKRLQSIFKEAGASTAEYADLEKLYGIERAKAVKDASTQMTSALKGLLDDLNIGDNGLSLGDRRANAMAKYQPLAEQVKAGDVSAYDDFAEAARALIDIERQISGSQSPYFALFDEVRGITQTALDKTTAIANGAANKPDIFAPVTAANDNASLISSINAMGYNVVGNLGDLGFKLDAVNSNLGALIQQGLAAGVITQAPSADPQGAWGWGGALGPMWKPAGNW